MPTEITISNQKFYNQYYNGVNFTTLTDYTPNLVGNVGDIIRHEFDIDVRWFFDSNTGNPLTVSATKTKITRISGSWIDDGFSIGDTIAIGTDNCTITALTDTVITYTGGNLVTDNTYTDLIIYGTSDLTCLFFNYGIVKNKDSFSDISIISGNAQNFFSVGVGERDMGNRITTTVNMYPLGTFKDWLIADKPASRFEKKYTVAYVSTNAGYYNQQKFHVVVDFIIPFYIEDYKNNLIDGTTPEELAGGNSWKFVYQTEFRTTKSNPNTSKIGIFEKSLGCVGWWDENFNGFTNDYTIDNLTFVDKDTSEPVDSLQLTKNTLIEFDINGTFNNDDPVGLMVFYTPINSEYQNKLTSVQENFNYDIALNTESATSKDGEYSLIKAFTANIQSGKLHIEAEINPLIYKSIVNNEYILGVSVGDFTKTSGNSNRVNIIVDYDSFTDLSADNGEIVDVERNFIEIFTHPLNPLYDTGFSQVELRNELGICAKYSLRFKQAEFKTLLSKLVHKVIALNTVTGDEITLDSYEVDLSDTNIVSGVQQFYKSFSRNYRLYSSDYFNKVKFDLIQVDGDYVEYDLYVGQKIAWQDWIKNITVPTEFYDSSKLNNNLNYKSSNYSDINNWVIKLQLLQKYDWLDIESGLTKTMIFKSNSPALKTWDYEEDSSKWTAEIQTFSENGTNLNGAILTTENTLFKTIFTRSSPFRSNAAFWAISRIESVNNPSATNIDELSSLYFPIAESLLIPCDGENFLKITVDENANTVTTECLIDFTKINPSVKYKLSTHLDDGVGTGYELSVTDENSINMTDENGFQIVIE